MQAMPMKHEVSPEKAILKDLGDISGVEIFNNLVLVAVYKRPEKTKSGLYLAQTTRDEDRFQSKVGLLVAHGDAAFQADDKWFTGATFKMHDWLVFRPSDGWEIVVNGVICRLIADTEIRARVDNPDRVY